MIGNCRYGSEVVEGVINNVERMKVSPLYFVGLWILIPLKSGWTTDLQLGWYVKENNG